MRAASSASMPPSTPSSAGILIPTTNDSPHVVADALRDLAHEPGPAFEIAAVPVLSGVGPRREELG